jgi:hypothetical protein
MEKIKNFAEITILRKNEGITVEFCLIFADLRGDMS